MIDYSEAMIEAKKVLHEIEELARKGRYTEAETASHKLQHEAFRLACWFWKERE